MAILLADALRVLRGIARIISLLYFHAIYFSPINYTQQYNTLSRDMTDVFQGIINHDYVTYTLNEPFRMLIYNGDSDIMCSFLEAEFFIDALADSMSASVTVLRQEWLYSFPGGSPTESLPVTAGFRKAYSFDSTVQMDLLTVKVSRGEGD